MDGTDGTTLGDAYFLDIGYFDLVASSGPLRTATYELFSRDGFAVGTYTYVLQLETVRMDSSGQGPVPGGSCALDSLVADASTFTLIESTSNKSAHAFTGFVEIFDATTSITLYCQAATGFTSAGLSGSIDDDSVDISGNLTLTPVAGWESISIDP